MPLYIIYLEAQLSLQLHLPTKAVYQQRGITSVLILFKKHLQNFVDRYERKYAVIYSRYRIRRLTEEVKKFILCGDYSRPKMPESVGIAGCAK